MSDHTKRTRSQLALPEEFRDVHFGISPLRAAKQERRRNLQADSSAESSNTPPSGNAGVDDGDQSDDELLLSPPKHLPQKRPPSSRQLGFRLDSDIERRFKRVKKDNNEKHSHVADMKQPCGPFDFSVIDSKQESSFIYSGHPAVSSKRAHSVPLVSQRDLGQLMPSPRKTPLVSPQREVLRFSSLPRILEPLADDMSILNIAMLPSYPEHAKYLAESHVSPTTKELGPVSSCEVPAMGVNNVSSHNGFSSVASSLEVIDSSLSPGAPSLLSDFRAINPLRAMPEGLDGDATPKVILPLPTSSPNVDVHSLPITPSDPLSPLSDDPPSPLSALTSLSELDHDPPNHDSEIQSSRVEPPNRTHKAAQPTGPSRGAASKSSTALPQVSRRAHSIVSRGRRVRGFARPSDSVRLTRSASMKKEEGSIDRDVAAKPQGIFSDPPGPPSEPLLGPPMLTPTFSKQSPSISHKKSFSFAMPTSSSLSKTVGKSSASSPRKPQSLLMRQPPKLSSPVKPVLFIGSTTPAHPSHRTGLSNLSLALEKLKIPPPSRPATTLGFNRDTHPASNTLGVSKLPPKAKDDSVIRLGNGLPSSAKAPLTPLRRAATVGSILPLEPTIRVSTSKPVVAISRPAQPPDAVPVTKKINLNSGVIMGKNPSSKPRGFIFGGVGKRRLFEKVSKKSSLPVVEASPVKESESARAINSGQPPLPSMSKMLPATSASHEKDTSSVVTPTALAGVEPMELQAAFAHDNILQADGLPTEDSQGVDTWRHASRRASLASQFLQQTLAVLPSTSTPQGTSSSKSKATEQPQPGFQGTRSGLRSGHSSNISSSRSTPGVPQDGGGAHGSRLGSTAAVSLSAKTLSLKVLKSCTIFVDVRTDDGDDAGGLFVDMLRGLGAKVIGRAGQSCTHIVYKNGLMSTLTKYRLMREPKPLVVGISWVVECAEQCRRVEEDDFLVDLESLNVAGNKRRRSMLPKRISSVIQANMMTPPSPSGSNFIRTLTSDQSIDGSSVGVDRSLNSSDGLAEDEDDIPPLERARQRRILFLK